MYFSRKKFVFLTFFKHKKVRFSHSKSDSVFFYKKHQKIFLGRLWVWLFQKHKVITLYYAENDLWIRTFSMGHLLILQEARFLYSGHQKFFLKSGTSKSSHVLSTGHYITEGKLKKAGDQNYYIGPAVTRKIFCTWPSVSGCFLNFHEKAFFLKEAGPYFPQREQTSTKHKIISKSRRYILRSGICAQWLNGTFWSPEIMSIKSIFQHVEEIKVT